MSIVFFFSINHKLLIIFRIDGNRGYPGLDAPIGNKGQKGSPGITGPVGRPVGNKLELMKFGYFFNKL